MSDDMTATEGQRTQTAFNDPLRRGFVAECVLHVHQIAGAAHDAILSGEDVLFETQVDLMRLTMREVLRTFGEIKKGGKQ